MDSVLKKAQRNFTIITIGVAVICAIVAALGTYVYAEQRLKQNISAAKIDQLTQDNPELRAYVASQAPYRAHFETIAGIIQREDRNQITTSLPIVLGALALISGLAGWWLSRRLLVPIKESYLSQRRFMQDAAHELRNPLAAMSTMIQQAENRPPKGPALQKFVQSLGRQATHLSAITTDLLLLEHREYQGTNVVNISDLLSDVIEELHHLAKVHKVAISHTAPSVIQAKIDPHHFVYIAKNMIENAIKFSPPNSKPISVQLSRSKGSWQLTVKDHGIGIPKEDLPNITQRFYRAKNASQTDGTGLGMAIVAKFVSIYGGQLHIESTPRKGTTVSVKI